MAKNDALRHQNHGGERIRRGLLPTAASITGRETINLKFINSMNDNPDETLKTLMRMLDNSPDAIISFVSLNGISTVHEWLLQSTSKQYHKLTYRILEFLNHDNMDMTHEALQKTKIGKTVNRLIQTMKLQVNGNDNSNNNNDRPKNADNATPQTILEIATQLFEKWKKIVAVHKRAELESNANYRGKRVTFRDDDNKTVKFKFEQPSQDVSRLADLDRRRNLKNTVEWKPLIPPKKWAISGDEKITHVESPEYLRLEKEYASQDFDIFEDRSNEGDPKEFYNFDNLDKLTTRKEVEIKDKTMIPIAMDMPFFEVATTPTPMPPNGNVAPPMVAPPMNGHHNGAPVAAPMPPGPPMGHGMGMMPPNGQVMHQMMAPPNMMNPHAANANQFYGVPPMGQSGQFAAPPQPMHGPQAMYQQFNGYGPPPSHMAPMPPHQHPQHGQHGAQNGFGMMPPPNMNNHNDNNNNNNNNSRQLSESSPPPTKRQKLGANSFVDKSNHSNMSHMNNHYTNDNKFHNNGNNNNNKRFNHNKNHMNGNNHSINNNENNNNNEYNNGNNKMNNFNKRQDKRGSRGGANRRRHRNVRKPHDDNFLFGNKITRSMTVSNDMIQHNFGLGRSQSDKLPTNENRLVRRSTMPTINDKSDPRCFINNNKVGNKHNNNNNNNANTNDKNGARKIYQRSGLYSAPLESPSPSIDDSGVVSHLHSYSHSHSHGHLHGPSSMSLIGVNTVERSYSGGHVYHSKSEITSGTLLSRQVGRNGTTRQQRDLSNSGIGSNGVDGMEEQDFDVDCQFPQNAKTFWDKLGLILGIFWFLCTFWTSY